MRGPWECSGEERNDREEQRRDGDRRRVVPSQAEEHRADETAAR